MVSVFTRRVIAYLMDFFVVSAFMWIVTFLLNCIFSSQAFSLYQILIYVVPIIIFVYFIYCEKTFGATVGKSIMYLQVRSKNGARISWPQAIVRNLTKIYWFPIIFDWAIGKILQTDRLLNTVTKTVVIDELR